MHDLSSNPTSNTKKSSSNIWMLYGIIDDDGKSLSSFSFMKGEAESSSLTLEMMKKKRITRTWKHIDETSRKLKCLNAWDHHHLIRCKFMVLFVIEESHISRIVLHSISIWLALPMEYPTKHGSLSLFVFSIPLLWQNPLHKKNWKVILWSNISLDFFYMLKLFICKTFLV